MEGKNIFIQSKSKSKRSIFYESQLFKKLISKNSYFKEVINIFMNLEEHLNDLFQKDLYKNINPNFKNVESNFSCSFSSSIKNYIKSPHIDRREHKFHLLYYPDIQLNKGGDICLWSFQKKRFMMFFHQKKTLNFLKKLYPHQTLV